MLLDTSGLLCAIHKSEAHHDQALSNYRSGSKRLTHSYVLTEFIALAHVRGVPRTEALSSIFDLLDNPDIEIIWVDKDLHRQALKLLVERPDKTYSLCDAVSFILMRQRGLTDALTTDRHFEQEGFRRLLASS